MKVFGLIGYPLGHSFSQKYFTEKFINLGLTDHEYKIFPIQNINELPELLKSNTDLCGLNVTIPHKIGVHYFLDEVDQIAKKVDAINCIKISKTDILSNMFSGDFTRSNLQNNYLSGFNTDVYGFEETLKPLLKKHHKKALILGNGGATRAIIFVLKKLKIDFKIVSRKTHQDFFKYSDLNKDILEDYHIIINATPVGTFPSVDESPLIPYQFITPKHLLYDLIYNPEETKFLRLGKENGATIKNGYDMLVLQAEKSWEIWNT